MCPYCAATLQKEIFYCPFCSRDLSAFLNDSKSVTDDPLYAVRLRNQANHNRKLKKHPKGVALAYIALALLLLGLLSWLFYAVVVQECQNQVTQLLVKMRTGRR
jgi:hypothetical protein